MALPETSPLPSPDLRNGHEPELTPRPGRSPWLVLKMIQVRLRLIGVLVVAFLVVGQWDVLRNRWDGLVRWVSGRSQNSQAVSSDVEFFCPMDPGVLSDWPGKCSICNMALVRRRRGEMVSLPDGVVARMQFSPYRLQLAGIQTSPVAYEPLELKVDAPGLVTASPKAGENSPFAVVEAELFDRDLPATSTGDGVEVRSESGGRGEPLQGKVREIHRQSGPRGNRVVIDVNDPNRDLAEGSSVLARFKRPIERLEPFRSQPANVPPLRKGEPRVLYVCPEHQDMLKEKSGRCPRDQLGLEPLPLAANQRVDWWCPMHPKVVADHAGPECAECGGMKLVPRITTFRPPGQVLSVPDSAVVDTGLRRVVYVERMPGMFDGVEVVLGTRCGDHYPVIRGLEPGQRVATSGAFLIDAETRLNPSLAASYFGSGSRPNSSKPSTGAGASRGKETASDKDLAAKQKICPVTGKALGSMGPPVRLVVENKDVMICCDGCAEALQSNPKKYLSKLP